MHIELKLAQTMLTKCRSLLNLSALTSNGNEVINKFHAELLSIIGIGNNAIDSDIIKTNVRFDVVITAISCNLTIWKLDISRVPCASHKLCIDYMNKVLCVNIYQLGGRLHDR